MTEAELTAAVRDAIAGSADPVTLGNALRDAIHEAGPLKDMPIDNARWVPIDMVCPNDYNPNSVAKVELALLATSIRHDGYTQPVVTIWDPAKAKYVIVDGFHRYFVLKTNPDLRARTGGLLPIVVIDKGVNDRMASTVRHNRARGKHSVNGMANMVFTMLENGWTDPEVCAELGMTPEEVVRLKHVTGFSKLFANTEYQRAWTTARQVRLRQQHENGTAAAAPKPAQDATPARKKAAGRRKARS